LKKKIFPEIFISLKYEKFLTILLIIFSLRNFFISLSNEKEIYDTLQVSKNICELSSSILFETMSNRFKNWRHSFVLQHYEIVK